jgi:hypothetical protein
MYTSIFLKSEWSENDKPENFEISQKKYKIVDGNHNDDLQLKLEL